MIISYFNEYTYNSKEVLSKDEIDQNILNNLQHQARISMMELGNASDFLYAVPLQRVRGLVRYNKEGNPAVNQIPFAVKLFYIFRDYWHIKVCIEFSLIKIVIFNIVNTRMLIFRFN